MNNYKPTRSNRFVTAYLTAALWSSNDNANEQGGEPLDRNYGIEDMSQECIDAAIADCDAFQEANRADLDSCEAGNREWTADEQHGHDFWLTRNGHGAGFWDRGYGEVGQRLSDAAHVYGSVDLYVGDDGQVHGQ